MSIEQCDAEQLPSIPLELIEILIIPISALSWLRVTKKYHILALKHAPNDPNLLLDPQRSLGDATYRKNYALLGALLTDQRYKQSHALSSSLNICPSDKTANMLFLQHCFESSWITERILHRAVRNDWIDIIDYALNHEDRIPIYFDSFSIMSEAVFDRVIHHPILDWKGVNTSDLAKNTQIPDKKKLKILKVPNIDLTSVIACFPNDTFVDALSQDERVLNSTHLQSKLWEKMIHKKISAEKIKMVLEKNLLDPSIDFNFPLREVLRERDFTEENKIIAQMILDDDRTELTLEPYDTNVIVCILKTSHSPDLSIEKIKFILNQPKFKREWFESTTEYLLFDQVLGDFDYEVIDPEVIFKKHQLDEYLSEDIRAKFPGAMKELYAALAYQEGYYNEYYNKMMKQPVDELDNPIE